MEQKEILNVLIQVKDHIMTNSYGPNPAYKWLSESWSNHDIAEAIDENNLCTKEETIRYLLDIAHLFGKDR